MTAQIGHAGFICYFIYVS